MKALAALVFACALSVSAQHLDVKDETKAEQQKALDELDHFGSVAQSEDGRPIIRIATHENGNLKNPWVVRVYIVDGTRLIVWEESGYPRLMLAVKAVEKDYGLFEFGYSGHYGQEKPGYCSDDMKCA